MYTTVKASAQKCQHEVFSKRTERYVRCYVVNFRPKSYSRNGPVSSRKHADEAVQNQELAFYFFHAENMFGRCVHNFKFLQMLRNWLGGVERQYALQINAEFDLRWAVHIANKLRVHFLEGCNNRVHIDARRRREAEETRNLDELQVRVDFLYAGNKNNEISEMSGN